MKLESSKLSLSTRLNGTPLLVFRLLRVYRPVPASKWLVAIQYILKTFLMLPACLYEKWFLKKKIARTEIKHTPVFVIGHYRSGTTLLHKLLATNPNWDSFSTYNFLFPFCPLWFENIFKPALQGFIRTFNIKHPHFNNYLVNLEDPLEEDMILISSANQASLFWSEVFPFHEDDVIKRTLDFSDEATKEKWKDEYLYLLKKKTRKNKGKQLILKNPPNTGRLTAVLELFPDAKFVFIHRNPVDVYYSTLNLWKNTLEKHYSLQQVDEEKRNQVIFKLYRILMGKYLKEREFIPDGNLVEVRYDNLKSQPYNEIRRIYQELNIPGFEEIDNDLKDRIEQEKNYKSYSYPKNAAFLEKIYNEWGEIGGKLGYG